MSAYNQWNWNLFASCCCNLAKAMCELTVPGAHLKLTAHGLFFYDSRIVDPRTAFRFRLWSRRRGVQGPGREMSRPRFPPLAVVSLLLACVSVAFLSGRLGVDISYSRFGDDEHRSRGRAAGSDASREKPTDASQLDGSGQDRGFFGWGGRKGNRGGGGNGGQRRARLAYLILSSGDDIRKLDLLLPEMYHPDNIYLVHVDAKAPQEQVERIRQLVKQTFPAKNERPPNGRLLEPAGIISWGGFSITLACLYGMAAALLWDDGWDYFINLSTSDFPAMTQDEMALFFGKYADSGITFLDGSPMFGFEQRWKGYVEDQGMQRYAADHTAVAMKRIGSIERPYPQLFRLFKGEFWGAFHRLFCEYASWSPDNVARTLSAYFTGYRISDESYFQTLACHKDGADFPIHGDNFRYTSWNEHHRDSEGRKYDANGNILIHPEPLGMGVLEEIKASGAVFARKFDLEKSQEVYGALRDDLRDQRRSGARLESAHERFRAKASNETGSDAFCGEHKQVRRRAAAEDRGR